MCKEYMEASLPEGVFGITAVSKDGTPKISEAFETHIMPNG